MNLNRRKNPKSVPERSTWALLVVASLAGCGGSEEDVVVATAIPPVKADPSVLSQFFVESFEAFETSAQQLIGTDARYLVQATTWYIDQNNNDRFDEGTDPEYETYPLLSSGAQYAHAVELTGAGQIIAIGDDGFLLNHEAFDGKAIAESGDFEALDHGTQVASVAAGSSAQMIGMAPGADLIFGGFDSIQASTDTAILAHEMGAVALNNSWNFVDTPVGATGYNSVFGGATGRAYLEALKDYAENGVVVFAASNDASDTTSGLMAALPLLEPELETGWLAAINADAVMLDGDVVGAARISAPCLEAARWCLAAEGTWVAANSSDVDSYGIARGTSFAAPMISGALAILGEAFPDLTPNELRIRLLASADNTFTEFSADGSVELVDGFSHDYSDEWGHGFLDVKAALLPIGTATATMSDGTAYDLAEPLAVEGGATGDAVTRSLAGFDLAVDDTLGAAFAVPADTLVAQQNRTPVTDAIWQDWEQGGQGECCTHQTYFPTTQAIHAVYQGTNVRFMVPEADDLDPSYAVSIGRTFEAQAASFSFDLGIGHDGGDLLPSWQGGSGSTVISGELNMTAPLSSSTDLVMSAGLAGAFGQGRGDATTARFDAAQAALVQRDLFAQGDRFSLRVGLPVAVSDGSGEVTLPVRTTAGAQEQQSIAIMLAPEAREMQYGFSYNVPVSDTADVLLAVAVAENAGHIAGQRSTGLLIGFRSQF